MSTTTKKTRSRSKKDSTVNVSELPAASRISFRYNNGPRRLFSVESVAPKTFLGKNVRPGKDNYGQLRRFYYDKMTDVKVIRSRKVSS